MANGRSMPGLWDDFTKSTTPIFTTMLAQPTPVPALHEPQATIFDTSMCETIVSFDTLLFVGFTEERALVIWNDWGKLYSRSKANLFRTPRGRVQCQRYFRDFMLSCLRGPKSGWRPPMGHTSWRWKKWMNKIGLTEEIRDEILDQRFKALWQTWTCETWTKDVLAMRFLALQLEQGVVPGWQSHLGLPTDPLSYFCG